jgi:hypothetical protein
MPNSVFNSLIDFSSFLGIVAPKHEYVLMLPRVMLVAHLHLAIQHEFVTHLDYYNPGGNSSASTADLLQYYEFYTNIIQNSFENWKEWRFSYIQGRVDPQGFDYSWTVFDHLRADPVVAVGGTEFWPNPNVPENYQKGTVMALKREAEAYMMYTLDSTFYLHNYIPELKAKYGPIRVFPFAVNGTVLGPYAEWPTGRPTILQGYFDFTNVPQMDNPGLIQGLTGSSEIVQDGVAKSVVSKFQVMYNTGPGYYVQDSDTGTNFNYEFSSDVYVSSLAGGLTSGGGQGLEANPFGVVTSFKFGLRDATNTNYSQIPKQTFSAMFGEGLGANTLWNCTMGPNWQIVSIGQVI